MSNTASLSVVGLLGPTAADLGVSAEAAALIAAQSSLGTALADGKAPAGHPRPAFDLVTAQPCGGPIP